MPPAFTATVSPHEHDVLWCARWWAALCAADGRLPIRRSAENVDVLWLRSHSIVRAFEVEHTASIYSGILRIADLLALQPDIDIKLHIVAPLAKREKVFKEIRRPAFSLLAHRALAESCTYLSYDSLRQLAEDKRLEFMSAKVLDDTDEDAEL